MAWKDRTWSFVVLWLLLPIAMMQAQQNPFKDAPASAKEMKNPVAGQQSAIDAGKTLYARNCLSCHGKALQGTGNVPSLVDGKLKGVTAGEIFWFVTKGRQGQRNAAMGISARREALADCELCGGDGLGQGDGRSSASSAPEPACGEGEDHCGAPKPPFTDFRYEKPGTVRKITVNDLAPAVRDQVGGEWGRGGAAAGECVAGGAARIQSRAVCQWAGQSAIDAHRSEWRYFPGGNAMPGRIRIFRGMTSDGKPEQIGDFCATGLNNHMESRFILRGPIRSGFISAARTNSCASRITMAI